MTCARGHETPRPGCRDCRRAARPRREAPPPARNVSLPCVSLGGVLERLACNCTRRWTYACWHREHERCTPKDDYARCEHYTPAEADDV